MANAHDLFAEVNPAFGVFVVIGFCQNYFKISQQFPEIALLYIAVPIAMSDDTQHSFAHSNARTGLLAWLNRSTELRINLGARVSASLPIVSASVKLGVATRALALGRGGVVGIGSQVPAKAHFEKLPLRPRQVIRRAERLGTWMAGAGTTGAIFSAFGIMP